MIGEQRGVRQVRDLAPAHEDLGVLAEQPGGHALVDQLGVRDRPHARDEAQPVLGDQVEVAGEIALRMRPAREVEVPLRGSCQIHGM